MTKKIAKLYGRSQYLTFKVDEDIDDKGIDLLESVWKRTTNELTNTETDGIYLDPFSLQILEVEVVFSGSHYQGTCVVNYSGIASDYKKHLYHVRVDINKRGSCYAALIYDHEKERLFFVNRDDGNHDDPNQDLGSVTKVMVSYDTVSFNGAPQEYIEYLKSH